MFIGINTYIILAGTTHFNILLPLVVVGCLPGLIFNCLQIHRKLWRYDMAEKAASTGGKSPE